MNSMSDFLKRGGVVTQNIVKFFLIPLTLILLVFFIFRFYVVVDAGERAVIINKWNGVLRVEKEGFHFMTPVVESATIYDVKTRTYNLTLVPLEAKDSKGEDALQALTTDGQDVSLDLSVRYHLNQKSLARLHGEVGNDYVNKVIRPQVHAISRLVVSRFSAEEILIRRFEIQSGIDKNLRESLIKAFIDLDEVLLRNVQFSKEFQETYAARQKTKNELDKLKYVLETQEMEKKRKILEAEGEAEAIRIKGKALTENPMLIQYEYVKLLAPNVQAIVTDQNSIFNFADFLKSKTPKK